MDQTSRARRWRPVVVFALLLGLATGLGSAPAEAATGAPVRPAVAEAGSVVPVQYWGHHHHHHWRPHHSYYRPHPHHYGPRPHWHHHHHHRGHHHHHHGFRRW